MEFLRYIQKHFVDSTLISSIVYFNKERITDTYEDNGYCQICSNLFDTISSKLGRYWDFNSSHTIHHIYEFLSNIVLEIYEQNKELRLKMAKEKVTKAREELDKTIKELENEL